MKHYLITETKPEKDIIAQSNTATEKHSLFVCEFDSFSGANQNELKSTLVQRKQTFALLSDLSLPKAAFFDMDGTLIEQETIVELARLAGAAAEVQRITESAMRGELDFASALKERVAKLSGMSTDHFAAVFKGFRLSAGVSELLATLREVNIPYFLVSGGFNYFARRIAEDRDFSGFYANELEIQHGKLTGKISGDIVDATAKKEFVLAKAAELNFKPHEIIGIGDGANDIQMLCATGWAIGYNPRDALIPHINIAAFGSHLFTAKLIRLAASLVE